MTDDRREDGRLRKIFSSLPRVGAPADFEGRVRRNIAAGTAGAPRARRRYTAFAVPALSLLVVGVLTIVIYQARFTGDPGIPVSPQDGPTQQPPVAVPGTAAPAGGETDRSPVTPLPEGGEAPEIMMKRSDAKGAATLDLDSKKGEENKPARSKTIPRLMKSEGEAADPPAFPARPAVPAEIRENMIMNSVVTSDSTGADSTTSDSTKTVSPKIDSVSTSTDTLRRAPDTTAVPVDPDEGLHVPPRR